MPTARACCAASRPPARAPARARPSRARLVAGRRPVAVRAFLGGEEAVAVPLDPCQALRVNGAASRSTCIRAFDAAVHDPPDVGYSHVRAPARPKAHRVMLRSSDAVASDRPNTRPRRICSARARRCSKPRRTR